MKNINALLERSITTRELIFILAAVLCVSPLISPPVALLLGWGIAGFIGHPYLHLNHRLTRVLLQVSIVGLGFGMNAANAIKAGREGLLLTVLSIAATLLFGWLLGRWMKVDKHTSFLISAGTAICGGSAIAAVSPVIRAEEKQVSLALGTVFVLNSVALFVFPFVGRLLHLSQLQFGLWSAVAIHDTSSVVGAAGHFGSEALEVATTVKLARALWIIPVVVLAAFSFRSKGFRFSVPYFILLFIAAMLLNTYVPAVQRVSHYFTGVAQAGLTLTLFLIGSSLSPKVIRAMGWKPLLQGVLLWVAVAAVVLWAVVRFF
ncbi:putative sulfate exporter family transporter [Chitinophaga lutea]|uniref:Putative sulfate exporter family transporter n=1 Tax=Chitinophaga lutea TaxID=2488634 RepID=A0A3N4PKP8_9BACT|nr:putative sulfate exporter family transporter [Chitinophaga lutea]RPE09253.1 putative sulfate exporter family transporter [Chitinophaga lutea]